MTEKSTLVATMRNANKEDMLSDAAQEEAERFLRAAYYTSVRRYAEDIAQEFDDLDSNECTEALDQRVDGTKWVMYTHRARQVAFLSDNVGAFEDEMGDDEKGTPEQVAYFALRADIRDLLTNEYFLRDMQEAKASERAQ